MKTRIILTTAFLILACNALEAQQVMRTAYFMDNYAYGYRFNPAFAPSYGHLSVAAGSIGISAESNMGISTFLYPTSQGLTTFLSPLVSDDKFLGKLKRTNVIHAGLDENLFSLAFTNKKGRFSSFEVNLRSSDYASVPYDLFRFVKAGAAGGKTDYSISNFGARSDNWLELAYGLSFSVNENLRVGARIKALAGIGQASIRFSKADFTVSDEIWRINAEGILKAGLPKGVVMDIDPETGIDFNVNDPKDLRPGGYGASVDIGASYRFMDRLTASLSINDIGFIVWNHSYNAVTPEMAWSFEGFDDIPLISDEGQQDFEDQVNSLIEDMEGCLELESLSGPGSSTTTLEAVINAGIEYDITQSLSAGALFTSHLRGMYSWTEVRGILTWAPGKVLQIAGSGAVSKFGPSLGAVLNLKLGILGLYVGIDSLLPFKDITPQQIPVGRINTNMNVGLFLAFSGRKE